MGRKECFEFIKQKIRQEDWEDLLRATENYAKSEESKDGFARDPIRFLKKDYWRDWVDVKDIKQLQRFNEDTHFRCEVCKTIKLKQDRVYVDGKAVCGQCEKEIDEEKKKDEQLFRELWEKMKDEEKQEYIRRLKRLNIPVPGWMVKEEK